MGSNGFISKMRLSHYSDKHVSKIYDVSQDQNALSLGCFTKPRGFWVSDDDTKDGWKSWCSREQFDLDGLSHDVHDIHLKDNANILYVRTREELEEFTEKFIKEITIREYTAKGINWHRVSELYDGIIITPYIWECRLGRKTSWYYGWDCASGCIWRASNAVEKINLRENDFSEVDNNQAMTQGPSESPQTEGCLQ